MTSKFALTERYNKLARQEIEAAGNPSYRDPDGRRFSGPLYDPEKVWGVSVEDIETFIETARKKQRSLSRKERKWAKDSYYLWTCRQSAMEGLEIRWM